MNLIFLLKILLHITVIDRCLANFKIISNENSSNFCAEYSNKKCINKRFVDPTFRGYPKTKEQIWQRTFVIDPYTQQTKSLVALLNKLVSEYLSACIPIILYDKFVLNTEKLLLESLFAEFPTTYMHGLIQDDYTIDENIMNPHDSKCRSYILFLNNILETRKLLGPQTSNRVIVISRSTQWKLQEFLASPLSRDIINLLVIGESFSVDLIKDRPYVLYTHQLYTDGLGANRPIVLTSWMKGRLSRPHVNLFPTKLTRGFSGHRFIISAATQQPYIIQERPINSAGNEEIVWEGIEYRVLKIFARMLNFTFEMVEPKDLSKGSGDAVFDEIRLERADIGLAGIYVTNDRALSVDISVSHSTDCASFITLTSKALPRYRAIMGPFQWPVWIALTTVYLIAILPLAFSDKLTLKHLIGNFGEVENMFWYVFGTFTNSLTFTGENSWSNTKKTSTRMLIGWYWIFTIIITACYTGSIIAFVTFPVFPETIDSIEQLLWGFYRIGTMDRGGWERWFSNSSHVKTNRLLKNLEFVANIEEGLGNVTKAFFWSYAFLGSRAQLEYIVSMNFTADEIGKRSALHISEECFSIFGIAMIFPKNSIYKDRFNEAILRFQSSGLMEKVISDVNWAIQKSGSGRLLKASKASTTIMQQEERSLTLADTEGMFLLLGAGFLIAGGVLLSEWVGGCTNRCREIMKRRKQEKEDIMHEIEAHRDNPSPHKLSQGGGDELESNYSDDDNVNFQKLSGHSRSTSSSILAANLSKGTLEELYHGPNRRHSSIIVMGGRMILESDALKYTARHGESSSDMKKVAYLDIEEIKSTDSERFHHVELNRPPTPFRADFDESFGEIVVHE